MNRKTVPVVPKCTEPLVMYLMFGPVEHRHRPVCCCCRTGMMQDEAQVLMCNIDKVGYMPVVRALPLLLTRPLYQS